MTSWIDRINAALVKRIRAKQDPEPEITAEGLRLYDGSLLRFGSLYRVVAFKNPALIGDYHSLALDFGDGRVVVVSEDQAIWDDVVRAIDHHPDRVLESKDWRVQLVADRDLPNGIEVLVRP